MSDTPRTDAERELKIEMSRKEGHEQNHIESLRSVDRVAAELDAALASVAALRRDG